MTAVCIERWPEGSESSDLIGGNSVRGCWRRRWHISKGQTTKQAAVWTKAQGHLRISKPSVLLRECRRRSASISDLVSVFEGMFFCECSQFVCCTHWLVWESECHVFYEYLIMNWIISNLIQQCAWRLCFTNHNTKNAYSPSYLRLLRTMWRF